MAALTIKPVDIQTIGTPSSFPIQSSSTNYLNHCVEELKPEVAASYPRNACLWKAASIATMIALAALMGVGIVVVGSLVNSIAVIGSSILLLGGVYFLTPPIVEYSGNCLAKAEQAQALHEIFQRFHALPTDANLLATKLASMAIFWRAIPGVQQLEDLHRFKALIAHHDYWVNQQALWEQKAGINMAVADVVDGLGPNTQKALRGEARNLITKGLKAAFYNQQEALICKVHAAFIHAVIMRPDFMGDFGNLVKFQHVSLKTRALAQQCGNTALANNLVHVQNARALTLDEIKREPITVLAHRFIQAMPPAA